jgi:hypothetical protein
MDLYSSFQTSTSISITIFIRLCCVISRIVLPNKGSYCWWFVCICRLGVVQGCWVVGIIDELQLCDRDGVERPLLIDTKTRNRPTPPSEPQKRNGRYMCGNI